MSQKVIVRHTRSADIRPLIELQRRVYPTIPPWREDMMQQLEIFPQGQIVAELNGELVGAASSLVVYGTSGKLDIRGRKLLRVAVLTRIIRKVALYSSRSLRTSPYAWHRYRTRSL